MNNIELLEFLNNVAYVHIVMQIISNVFYISKNEEIRKFGVLLMVLLILHFIHQITFLMWEKPEILELFSGTNKFYLVVFLSYVSLMLLARKMVYMLFKNT